MSIYALLPAVRNRLRSECGFRPEECRVMPGANPPPVAGDRFISVFGLEWAPGDPDLNRGIDEFYGVGVALSIRCGWTQYDDIAEELFIKTGLGADAILRKINAVIHQSYEVINGANAIIPGGLVAGAPTAIAIVEPLRWSGGDATPMLVGDDWFQGGELVQKNKTDSGIAGLVLQTNFSRARRLMSYDNMIGAT